MALESLSTTFETISKRFMDSLPEQKQVLRLANASGVAFYFVLSVVVYLTCVFVIIPSNYSITDNGEAGSGEHTIPVWILTFFVVSMMINYLLAMCTSTYYDSGKLDVPTAEGGKNWGYCVPCQQYIPPRAHHCAVCKQCVLKRESHCFFLGNCVGHTNQRFFVVYLFYCALASLFSFLSIGMYLHRVIGPILSWQTPYYLVPVAAIRFLSGSFPVLGCIALVLFYATLMIGVGCSLLFFHHMNLILQGQTSFEMAMKTNSYDSGAQMNLREVFGRYWWLCFLLPIKFSQPVDGIKWSRVKEIKKY